MSPEISGPVAVVRWEDTTNIAAWSDAEELDDFARNGAWVCENVGWVLVDNEDCIVLAGRRTTDGKHVGLFERIPRRAIISVHEIPATKPRPEPPSILQQSDGSVCPPAGNRGPTDVH